MKGNVCVLDNGVGIQIYNEKLEKINEITFEKHSGVGLSFNQNQYYIQEILWRFMIII